MPRFRLASLVLPLALALSSSASAEGAIKLYDRLYLLASDEGFVYWGVDPTDPELSAASVRANCPGGGVPFQGNGVPCFTSTHQGGALPAQNLDIRFSPAALLDEPITWNSSNPLRYHLEMEVTSTFTPTIAFVTERGGVPTESTAGTEVAPNVWEGRSTTGGPLSTSDRVRVRVRIPLQYYANRTVIEIATGGASWIQLPRPIRAASVQDLVRQSPDAAEPLRFDSPNRHFTFNDANYTVGGPYTGDLSQSRRFDLPIPQNAAIVYAWVEAFDTPFMHDALSGRPIDRRKVNDTPVLALYHDDDVVARSTSEANQQLGRGTNALATNSVPAGTLSLEVKPRQRFSNDLSALEPVAPPDHPYKAYVLAIHGQRTLQTMRWRFEPAISEPFIPVTLLATNTCVNPSEPVPTTKEVTTFSVDLRWENPALNTARYTLTWNAGGQEFNFCGQSGHGSRVRLMSHAEKVWPFAATPAKDTTMVGWRDTVFEMAVRFAYTAAPV